MKKQNSTGEPPRLSRVDSFLGHSGGRLALYAVLAVLCVTTYHGIRDNYLFNDDFSWIAAARYDMTPGNLLTLRVVHFFRPLINISFYLSERIAPGKIALYSSANLAVHFLNSMLVFALISSLIGSQRVAAAAAVLFAVSSLHTGAVFWISARTTLLSTFFLLSSLTVATRRMDRAHLQTTLSTALYALALAAKETAIAGVALLALIHLARARWRTAYRSSGGTLLGFAAVSIVYLSARMLLVGGFFRSDWGPGLHVLRNLAGGFLYQLYPFPFLSLAAPRATGIPEPAHPFMPELFAAALVAFLLWIGVATKRTAAYALGVGWCILALLPASGFTYRFFSTASFTQNRYYYLSSVGSILIVTLLLGALWNGRSKLRQPLSAALFVMLCAGSMVRVHRLEKKWEDFTGMYRAVVTDVLREIEKRPNAARVAIENPPLAFPYIAEAILVESARRTEILEVGGRDEAEARRPCLYISYTGHYPTAMRIEWME